MRECSRKHCYHLFDMILTIFFISALGLCLKITAHAGVSATNIVEYLNEKGDSYYKLTQNGKAGYEIARKDALNDTETREFDSEDAFDGYYYYLYDHPAIKNSGSKIKKSKASETLQKAVQIANSAKGSTRFDMARSLHDSICDTVTYHYQGGIWRGQSAYEALVQNQSVCAGYAEAYKLLCDLKDIPCDIVYGKAFNGSATEAHAWNVARLDDGQWYEVDVTWDDTPQAISDDYFCVTTAAIADYFEPTGGLRTSHIRTPDIYEASMVNPPVAYGTNYPYQYPVTDISIEGASIVYLGKSSTLSGNVFPDNATVKSLNWWSSDSNTAYIDPDEGILLGLKEGKVTIYASARDHSGAYKSFDLDVVKYNPITDVEISGPSEVNAGSFIQLSTKTEPSGATATSVVWSSSDTAVATVDKDGVLTGQSEGKALIRAEFCDDSSVYDTFEVTVKNTVPPEDEAEKSSSETGNTDDVPETGQPSATETDQPSDTESEQPSAPAEPKAIAVKAISLNRKTVSVNKGKTITLSAAIKPVNATNKAITWNSGNPKVASVDKNGKVKALKKGKAVITATTIDGSKRASCSITVLEPVKKVRFAKKSYTVKKGKTIELKPIISPRTASDQKVTWKCSNKKIAVIDKNGKVKGLRKGKVKITVTTRDGRKKATCILNVK